MEFQLTDETIQCIDELVASNAEWSIYATSAFPWTKEVFDKVCLYLSDGAANDEKLLVTGAGMTLEINGLPNISRYCYADSVTTIKDVVWKRHAETKVQKLPDEFPMNLVAVVKESTVIKDVVSSAEWANTPKTYVIEKVISSSKDYRLSVVRKSAEATTTMTASGVSAAQCEYVIEVVGTNRDSNDVIKNCLQLVQVITGNKFPLSKSQQLAVLQQYDTLIAADVKVRPPKNMPNGSGERYFFAPKPITLETINLVEPGGINSYGINSIFANYAVSEKADGERMLMYVDGDGAAYFINNTFEISFSGLKTKDKTLAKTLLDGEFVTQDAVGADVFAVFDIYYSGGKKVTHLPLFSGKNGMEVGPNSRFGIYMEVCDKSKWSVQTHTELRGKAHIAADGADMRAACGRLLKNVTELPYEVDGLIFTPRMLSVFGYYPGKIADVPPNVKWDKVLKWKPAQQNSIDFLVEFGHNAGVISDPLFPSDKYQQVKLFTGYNAAQWEPITPLRGIELRYNSRAMNAFRMTRDAYRAKQFEPVSYYEPGVGVAHIKVSANGGIYCEDGTKIESKSIVEFAYDAETPNKKASRRWIPMRVRVDKTRIFQKTGQLSKTANDMKVATNIWRSIHAPVTAGMITGVVDKDDSAIPDTLEERLLGTDDVYYAREIHRSNMLSVHMLNFHNHGIKRMLYQRSTRRDSLIEFACGMAGDMPRWRDCGYKFVLGIDLSRDNITQPSSGAYARMLNQSRAVKTIVEGVEDTIYPDVAFVVGDCALPIHTGATAEGRDEDSVRLLHALYRGGNGNASVPPALRNRAARGFSVASCMFAIHYFFKNEETLNGFLTNVSHNLVKGGIFICTFMDGEKVEALLDANNGIVEGRKLTGGAMNSSGVPVWAIVKQFSERTDDTGYGKTVGVFLENTNKLISEYLVSIDHLIEVAKTHGLELDTTEMFSEEFNRIKKTDPRNKDVSALDKDPVQKQFSFLNRWAVFRKAT